MRKSWQVRRCTEKEEVKSLRNRLEVRSEVENNKREVVNAVREGLIKDEGSQDSQP